MTHPNPADQFPEFKVIKLRPAGPKPGQSQASFLRGKAQGDRQWNRRREANFGRLLRPAPWLDSPRP